MMTKTTNKITKIEVNKAASLIAGRGKIPTIAAVRAELQGMGSETTIHKYLQEWKKVKLLAKEDPRDSNTKDKLEASWIEENRNLEQALNKQIEQNGSYAQELIQAEKTIIVLKEENQQLKAQTQKLELELKEVNAIKVTLEKINQEIQLKLEIGENDMINKQQLLIEELQQELKNLNAKSMQAIQEISSQGHEVLMQEKVNAINLQAKIDNLHKELAESKKQLELANFKTHVQQQALERQINWQQQILKKYVPQEELQTLKHDELFGVEDLYGK